MKNPLILKEFSNDGCCVCCEQRAIWVFTSNKYPQIQVSSCIKKECGNYARIQAESLFNSLSFSKNNITSRKKDFSFFALLRSLFFGAKINRIKV